MKQLFSVFAVLFLILAATEARAQFEVYGELRPRAESRYGYKTLPSESNIDPAIFISQRSRVGIKWQNEDLKFKLSAQDVRVWGDESQFSGSGVFGEPASIDLFEAWFEWSASSSFSVRVGRQPWAYDDQRLLSGRNWNNNGLLYDGVLMKFGSGDFQMDVGASWNSSGAALFENNYDLTKLKTLNFIRLENKLSDDLSASFTTVLSGKQRSFEIDRPYLKSTNAVYLTSSGKPFGFQVSGFFQFGKNQAGNDVSAWMFNAEASYAADPFVLKAGADMLSGSAPDDEKDKSFDPLYGARHKFYGVMDHYSSIPKATRGGGLHDIFATVEWKAVKKGKIGLTYHNFSMNQAINNEAGDEMDKSLGSEIDLSYSQKVHKMIGLKGGVSFMLPKETHQTLKGVTNYDKTANWVWLMLSFKPEIFVSE